MTDTSPKTIRIGAGAGYSGDRIPPAVELADKGDLDYLVFECLAERTIALAQLERSQDARLGFDPLLRDRMEAVLLSCASKGVKIITNMGAANPQAAGEEVIKIARELGLARLKVAVVHGDDVLPLIHEQALTIMESGAALQSLGSSVLSANAYIGAEALVEALQRGADVVITGRVADPALFLAPLIHEFGWSMSDWQKMGQGTVIGHLLECAGQVTGGYFADPGYRDVPDLANLGFPFAEVSAEGHAIITKVEGSGGCVTVATCTAQLLYEIEDPASYLQPDVAADFSGVTLTQVAPNRVRVEGATGRQRPASLKVTVGHRDGFIGEGQISYAGLGAQARGQLALDVLRQRLDASGIQALDSRYELIGVNAIHGPSLAAGYEPYEVRARVAMRVTTRKEAERVANEVEAMYLNGPASGGGVTKSVREVIAAVSVLVPRDLVRTSVTTMEL
ncbi:MAG: acyclic terpene utilization AtuA family protein [Polaromonas sp.]|nr:acyclic terpene utilization AtuA family protein [Polaromonas sp.]MDP2820055.1 acyclic terpene utilization AtuA family protein [Polaromonas sp.]